MLGEVAKLQGLCRELALPLIGGVFPALMVNNTFTSQGVWLLRLNRMPPAKVIKDIHRSNPAERIVASILPHMPDQRTTLFMLFDSMIPNIGSILDEMYLHLADRVRYVGASVGSETFQPMPCVFDQHQCVQDGVAWLLLPTDRGTILEHGYQIPESVLTATATEGNRIISIDWRPAFEVYQELMQAQYGITLTQENFYQHAVHFPFGILRANDEIVVRIPVSLESDGSLFFAGEIPAHTFLALLNTPLIHSQHTVDLLTEGLTALHGSLIDQTLLTFYCAGRRLHLGECAHTELVGLQAKTGVSHQVGALTLGEIGHNHEWDYPLFHNATLVCSIWNAG